MGFTTSSTGFPYSCFIYDCVGGRIGLTWPHCKMYPALLRCFSWEEKNLL